MEKSKQNSCKLINHSTYQLKKVRIIGVEPTWIAPPDPKSGASANFAISAFLRLLPPGAGPYPLKGCKSKGFMQNRKQICLRKFVLN